MTADNEKSDLILCLNRLKDNYIALYSLISNTIHLKNTNPLKSLSAKQSEDFWRIQFAFLIEQVVLTHCKLLEVKNRYAKLLPANERQKLNQYFTNDRVAALQAFRNKCSGHAIDKDTKRPLDTKILQNLIIKIFDENNLEKSIVPSFFDSSNPSNPNTLIGIIEDVLGHFDETKT